MRLDILFLAASGAVSAALVPPAVRSPMLPEFFVIPARDGMTCRPLPYVPVPGGEGYEFWIGPEDPHASFRTISVTYASEGEPVDLIETHSRPASHPDALVVAALSLRLPEAAAGFVAVMKYGDARGQMPPPMLATTPLSPQQVAKAHVLAAWLWQHRCAGSVRPPN
ncbi:MAG: hypothetical protein WD801_03710 [Gemmatimonadaceae bacterium]